MSDEKAELFVASCSVTTTRRRRFLWAAWWTAAPAELPFRKPDAYAGGARTAEEAWQDAERVAGRSLTMIEGRWARAWSNVLQGLPPFPRRAPHEPEAGRARPAPREASAARSIWSVLGLTAGASEAEIRGAYRRRALVTHPDHGGEPAAFRELHQAYERALARAARPGRR